MIFSATFAPLVVFFGGFGSCFINGNPAEIRSSEQIHQFAEFLTKKSSADSNGKKLPQDPTVVKTCYALGNRTTYSAIYQPATRQHSTIFAAPLDELIEEIDMLARKRPVILIGQSHGGWTAMKVAGQLSQPVTLLATIDPISVINCHAAAFSISTTGYATAGFTPWSGCTEAPTDFGDELEVIRENAQNWLNFYQLETRFLHSSRISIADANIRVRFNSASPDDVTEGSWNPFQAHAATETSPRIWRQIKTATLKVLSGLNQP